MITIQTLNHTGAETQTTSRKLMLKHHRVTAVMTDSPFPAASRMSRKVNGVKKKNDHTTTGKKELLN